MLLDASSLAGRWRLDGPHQVNCTIELSNIPSGNGLAASGDATCLSKLGLNHLAMWRAASDGLALADYDGRTIGFFSRRPDSTFSWAGPAGAVMLSKD